jgi:hypothetical protein
MAVTFVARMMVIVILVRVRMSFCDLERQPFEEMMDAVGC